MRGAGHDGPPGDPIAEYLDQLRAGLRVTPGEAELILAEAEDHLRETAAAALAAGLTEREAQEAAISSFGPVRAVSRAHHQARHGRVAAVAGEVAMAAWKLASLLVLADGVSGLVTVTIFAVAYPRYSPAGIIWVVENKDFLWLVWSVTVMIGVAVPTGYLLASRRRPSRQPLPAGFLPVLAASLFVVAVLAYGSSGLVTIPIFTLTASSPYGGLSVAVSRGALWLEWSVTVMIGVALLAGYRLARRQWRRGQRPELLPAGFFPVLATSFFAAVALVLLKLNASGTMMIFNLGPVIVVACLALAVGYATSMARKLLGKG